MSSPSFPCETGRTSLPTAGRRPSRSASLADDGSQWTRASLLKTPSARRSAIRRAAPRMATIQAAGVVWARTPIAFATKTPRNDPNDAHDDVRQDPHLGVGLHQDARQPADDATDDESHYEVRRCQVHCLLQASASPGRSGTRRRALVRTTARDEPTRLSRPYPRSWSQRGLRARPALLRDEPERGSRLAPVGCRRRSRFYKQHTFHCPNPGPTSSCGTPGTSRAPSRPSACGS